MFKEIKLVLEKQEGQDILESEFMEAPDSFFTKIVVQDVLEKSNNRDILNAVSNKVRREGTLILEGIDAMDICRRVHYGGITLAEASTLIFHQATSLYSVASLKEHFLAKEWAIKFAGLKEGRYFLETTRP